MSNRPTSRITSPLSLPLKMNISLNLVLFTLIISTYATPLPQYVDIKFPYVPCSDRASCPDESSSDSGEFHYFVSGSPRLTQILSLSND